MIRLEATIYSLHEFRKEYNHDYLVHLHNHHLDTAITTPAPMLQVKHALTSDKSIMHRVPPVDKLTGLYHLLYEHTKCNYITERHNVNVRS